MSADLPTRTTPADPVTVSVPSDATRTGPPVVDEQTVSTDSALPLSDVDAPPGYVVERELGVGGMGVVYLARQTGLNRPVALKLVKGAADTKALIRFLAEAEAVAAVRHPNVVEVYAYGDHHGRPYMAMEFCPGGDLTTLRGDAPVSREAKTSADHFRKTAELMAGVSDGVNAAHLLGIVHRDLKPHNVFLAADGTPKVADFGLAKRGVGSDLTQTDAVMGTPAYMAPEQAGGGTKFVGPEADVWALGVMLYELACGTRPIDASGPMLEVMGRVIRAEIAPLKSNCPAVPSDLALIAHKCLSKDPRDRYPPAGGLADDLRHWLAGKPISARPAGVIEQAVRWARRNPLPATLIASLAVLAVAVGVSAYLIVWQVERGNYQEAKRLLAEERQALTDQRQLTDVESALRQATRRGEGTKAETLFNNAVGTGLTPSEGMRLDFARAAYFLGETTESGRRLAGVNLDRLSVERRGDAELLRGLLLLGEDEKEALAAMRAARELKLAPADDAFAAGMLAEYTAEALTHFRRAFGLDPAHIHARMMAASAVALLARYDDANALIEQAHLIAPDHTIMPGLSAIVAGVKGDQEKVNTLLNEFAGNVRDPKFKEALPAVAEVFAILPELRKDFQAVLPGEDGALPTIFDKWFGPKSGFTAKVQTVLDAGFFQRGMNVGLPPCFRADVTLLMSECLYSKKDGNPLLAGVFKKWLPGLDTSKSAFAFNDKKGQEEAKKALARFPEGTLKGMYGVRVFEVAQDNPKAFGNTAIAWDEATAALEDAAHTPGHFATQQFSLESAAFAMHLAAIRFPKDDINPGHKHAILRLIEERMRLAPPPNYEVYRRLSMAASHTGNGDAALWVLSKWGETLTKPDREYQQQRAMAEITNRRFGAALEELSKIDPPDEFSFSMTNLCRRKLGMRELLPPPRKVE